MSIDLGGSSSDMAPSNERTSDSARPGAEDRADTPIPKNKVNTRTIK
jgi:hypothetical protein